MCDELIPEERILAVQEALCGFINDEILDVHGESTTTESHTSTIKANMITLCKLVRHFVNL